MKLSEIINHLAKRGFATRKAWNKQAYIAHKKYHSLFLFEKNAEGNLGQRPYSPCLEDMVANDWETVEFYWKCPEHDYLPFHQVKWEPEGGKWEIDGAGNVFHMGSVVEKTLQYKRAGNVYPTKKQALTASDIIIKHKRLVAFIREHFPEWDGAKSAHFPGYDWQLREDSYVVEYSPFGKNYVASPVTSTDVYVLGTMFMPRDVAEKLCEGLNNGMVEL